MFPTGDSNLERDPWREILVDGEIVLVEDFSDELGKVVRSLEDSVEEEKLGSTP